MLLKCTHKCMSHFMIRNDLPFLLAQNLVFLLFTDENHFHCLKKIFLGYPVTAFLDCQNCRLIDHVRQVRTDSSAGGKCDLFKINGLIQMNILRMHFEDIHTPLKIRTIYNDSPVKTARAEKGGIQYLRTVGCRQDQEPTGGIKAIHLCQKLIQRLFPFVVSTTVPAVTAFTNRIDLIDKNDARGIFLRLIKEFADTGCTYTDKHFHKIRTGNGKERHMCLTGYRLRQKRLTGSRRPDKKCSFGKLGSNGRILSGIFQKIHHFLKRFLRFILSCHIFEGYACLLLGINLCFVFSHIHDTSAAGHFPHDETKCHPYKDQRDHQT